MFELGVIIAVLVGLGQLVKQFNIPSKFIPLIMLALGIVCGFFFTDATAIQDKIILGIMIGLSASGLFDQTKIIYKK